MSIIKNHDTSHSPILRHKCSIYSYLCAFEVISAAAYLRGSAQANRTVFERSKCDMLFIMEPIEHGWEIEIVTATRAAEVLKRFICEKVDEIGFDDITLF